MRFGRWVGVAALCLSLVATGCGGGSGRRGSDVVVSGVGPSTTLNGGDVAAFVMTVTNVGDFDATDLTIKNVVSQIPQSTLSITCVAAAGSTCPAALGTTMTLPVLPAGGQLVFSIAGPSALGASGNVGDTMSVSVGSGDPDTSNNSVTITSPVVSNDISITATAPTGPLTSGPATFTMVVSNAGPDDAVGVNLVTSVSSNVTFVPSAITCVANPNTGSVPNPVASIPVLQADNSLTSALIPAFGGLTCQVPVTVNPATDGFAVVNMQATVAGDSRSSNNKGSASVQATLVNDLSVVVTPPTGPLTSPQAVFTAAISNAGPSTASGMVVTVTLSTALTANGPVSCVPAGGVSAPTLQSDGTLLVASFPPSGTLNCSVPTLVTAGTNGLVGVTVALSTTDDPKTGNNSSQGPVQATLLNDIDVTATAPAGPLVDANAVFSATISNAGPATASNLVISNTLTAGLSLNGAITCVPAGGASTPVAQNDGTLQVATMPLNATLTCSIPTTVSPGTNGLVADTVSVTVANDPRTVNNSAQAAVQATITNNVGVVAGPVDPSFPGGGSGVFTMTVSNSGPSVANNVTLSNTLTGALNYGDLSNLVNCSFNSGSTSAPPAAFVLTPGTLTATSSVAAIAVGDVLTCNIPFTVTAGANGTIAATFAAAAPFDQVNLNNTATATTVATSADVGVSQTASSTVAAGNTVSFVGTVANPRGQGSANNMRITWTPTLPGSGPNVVQQQLSCLGLGGATCPTSLGTSMTLPSLPTGASLQFTATFTTAASDRGTISNAFSVQSDGDPNTSNNAVTSSTTLVDPRSGQYTVFAADGRQYQMTVDFDGVTNGSPGYTMAGQGVTVAHAFTMSAGNCSASDGSGDCVASDNAAVRFRIAQDLLVGSHDFNGVVLPYVAARSFVNSVAQIAGTYNLATRVVPSGAAASTHAGTALVSGNTLSVCQSDTVEVKAVSACSASALTSYTLSVAGNAFTGLDSSGNMFHFYVANSGAAKMLLSAASLDTSNQQFRVGLVDSPGGLSYGNLRGGSTTGAGSTDWLAVSLTANPATYAATSALGTGFVDGAALTAINNVGGPSSMVKGTSSNFAAQIYVMQAAPLGVVLGSSAVGGGSASGYLQLLVP